MRICETTKNVLGCLIGFIVIVGAFIMALPMLIACAIDDHNETKRRRRGL